jgi:diguanylate cyclase (GGDEF)-like protein
MASLDRLRRLVDQHADRSSLPHAAAILARLLSEAGNREGARIALADGLVEAEALGAKTRQAALHRQASELEEADGRFAEALQHFKRFHALLEECAIDAAQRKHIAMTALMDTERAIRDAQAERQRALQLTEANHALRTQATQLSRAALTDALTGLSNRRFLEEELPHLHTQARAAGRPFHVAILDIDHFKAVNDRFSHACGDAVLREVAALMTRHARGSDICARYGGEEFVLILPGANADAAQLACERHRRAIDLHDWRPLHPDLRVTVSIGVADAVPHDAVSDALAVADARLYAAKRGGRNRVIATG